MASFKPDTCRRCQINALVLAAVIVVLASFGLTSSTVAAETGSIAVLYPDIGDPYREIFQKIIDGIDEKVSAGVESYPVSATTNVNALRDDLSRHQVKVIIALGRQGMNTAMLLNSSLKLVVGGVFSVPQDDSKEAPVVSLTPDPGLLFEQMKSIMPSIRRIYVVYDPHANEWLMKMAQEEAHANQLELVTYKAQDVRQAVGYYQEIFSKANPHSDALWLPLDPTTVEDSTVLPMVLQESWSRSLAVFSSNFNYVKRGLLFSLYPDNVGLGNRLAGLAQDIVATGRYGKRGLMPLQDVQSAVNLRTANHLGLTSVRRQSFDLTFPAE
jgi:putative ABC transport system substrate-binding protein